MQVFSFLDEFLIVSRLYFADEIYAFDQIYSNFT